MSPSNAKGPGASPSGVTSPHTLPSLDKLWSTIPIDIYISLRGEPVTTIDCKEDWTLEQLRDVVRQNIDPGLMPPNWLFSGRPGVKETVSLWVKVLASYTLVAALTRPLLLSNLKFSQEVESMWLCRDMGGAVSIISSFVPNLQPTEPTSQRQAARNQLGKLGNGDS